MPRDLEAIEDDQRQYGRGPLSQQDLDQQFPNRPHNHSKTLPFHVLFTTLFNPLIEARKGNGPAASRRRGLNRRPLNPQEGRRAVISRFISRWRTEVGDDFYPALRLIIPEKDRDRALYGLKEKAIGRLLVKVMNISPNSEDGYNLLNWKLPGQTTASRMAGDFAGRCYEVLSKRPMRTKVGDMRIAEVNELLDQLSAAQKEPQQLPIMRVFYNRMNAEELKWLVRVILKEMKVGASEKTYLNLWHPDGEVLFNISSNLRRVCWELTDPTLRLDGDETNIELMECFQPQLAQFQMHSFQKMVDNMRPTEDDPEFWIEEKLDGERMQLHMKDDDSVPGGRRFAFWSRRAKDYTFLYGHGLQDDSSALTRHLKDAFDPDVRNIILDGEMITWDPEADIMVPFGTLKTAANAAQRNPFSTTEPRPLFRVFDILYLNDEPLTRYTLRDRRRALERTVRNVHRRLEIHTYEKATTAAAIEPLLRKVVAEASEGLVLKNPRSPYRLNSRNDDWMKVKPEYMEEFGEELDCIIIGGYYGSGHRGGRLGSFLCGLRVDQNHIQQGADPMKHYSFCKVGGGFKAEDFNAIRHHTDGKWIDWDARNPPTKYIELAGGHLQYERPDVWIKPSDSIVISIKAASVYQSDTFRMGMTLRFPRFKSLRLDKDWTLALSINEFQQLKTRAEKESEQKAFKVDTTRKRVNKRVKKEIHIAGAEEAATAEYTGPATDLFEGFTFCILSDALHPEKKSKADLEQLVTANGGNITQNPNSIAADGTKPIIVADKRVVKAASLIKARSADLIRPGWILDAVKLNNIDAGKIKFLLPYEPQHIFFSPSGAEEHAKESVDEYGDSYVRDLNEKETNEILDGMEVDDGKNFDDILTDMIERGTIETEGGKGWLFRGIKVYFLPFEQGEITLSSQTKLDMAKYTLSFGAAKVSEVLEEGTTHVVVPGGVLNEASADTIKAKIADVRKEISGWTNLRVPRIVTTEWVSTSWEEGTRVDEASFAPV